MTTVQQLMTQQLGLYNWRSFDSVLERFRCVDNEEFKHIYPDHNSELETYLSVDSPIFACKFAQKQGNEHILALANEDGKMALHNTMKDTPRVGKQIHHNAIFDLAWMFKQMKIVTVSGDHTARLVDVSESEIREERMFSGHTRSVKTLAIKQNDSSIFATGSRDGNILVWDTRSTSNIALISNPDKIIANAHYSKHLTPTKKKVYQNQYPSISGANSVTGLVFQDDNTLISCSAGDGAIKLWDLRKTYKANKREPCPRFIIPYSGSTSKCGFSNLVIDQECVKLYANCLDNTIYCYNVSNYNPKPIKQYNGHENNTFYVKSCLSADGTYLLSGSSDHNAYIWNTHYTEPIVKLTGHTAEVTCVAWYQEYDLALVTCSDDYRHKIWRIGPEVLPDNWEIHGRGLAQKIISKRCLDDIDTVSRIKKQKTCPFCDFLTDKHCENCDSNASASKRLAVDYLEHEPKRRHSEGAPQKLFDNLRIDMLESIDEDVADVNPKRIKLDLEEFEKKTDNLTTPTSKSIQISPEVFSPTTNLPNFNVDGCAPHLNYSPQKKADKDWLTKIRVEKCLMREMRDLAGSRTTPTLIKLDNLSPKTRSLKRQAKIDQRCNNGQAPILKFFRVTNSSIMKDSSCSPKATLAPVLQK